MQILLQLPSLHADFARNPEDFLTIFLDGRIAVFLICHQTTLNLAENTPIVPLQNIRTA